MTPTIDRPVPVAVRNEHGVALLIVLIVVALLTITVTEFTYSVQIDLHRTRNALHALQAQLLARSGVNLAEGFLMLDEEPKYDAYSEDWFQRLKEFCTGLQLDDTMRLRCSVRDESGKLNINNTRGVKRVAKEQKLTGAAMLREAMRCMFHRRNIEVGVVDDLLAYWERDPTLNADGSPQEVPDFGSLDDFAAQFQIPAEQVHDLRNVMTAQPARQLQRININTAPSEVLSAVLNADKADCEPDKDVVQQIVQRQMDPEQPFTTTGDIVKLLPGDENANLKATLFGVQSRLYRLEASAQTNVDPTDPTSGGIGQTLSVLVVRQTDPRPRPGGPQVGANGEPIPNWTLRPLDWQKEGGARLFRSVPTDENLPGNPDDQEESNDAARSM